MLDQIRKMFKHSSDEGATAVEYGLMVALIAVVIIVAVVALGKQTCETFDTTAQSIKTKSAVTSATGCK